jgi:drug/metabolite transporter (DMT)-like permease
MKLLPWATKTALIYYLIPVLVGIGYFFLNQAIVLTQIISMVIIITGLLLTNKSMTFRFIKNLFLVVIINATSILLL